jgi:hypothetical protein
MVGQSAAQRPGEETICMLKKAAASLALLATGWTLLAPAAQAQPATPPAPPGAPPIAGWNELVDSLRVLPDRILAKLPEAQRNDPQVQQEAARLALQALVSQGLEALAADGDHPVFLPSIGQVLDVGQPNADTVYRSARITPGGSYRLRGQRGSLRIFKVGQTAPNMGEHGTGSTHVGAINLYDDFNTLHVDRDGRFDVLLSPERPAGYTGDWWRLDPNANRLLLRMVSSDWTKEQAPTLSIERVDRPVEWPRESPQAMQARLARLPPAASAIALLFADHVEGLRQAGYVNKLKVLDVSQQGGLTGQFYYEGDYDLADDEALIVEAKVPAKCGYWSAILTNELYQTTDWYNNQSSLNDSQARVDKDGMLRIVVSTRDPGVPNWLDTAGWRQGLIQGRWTDCDAQPVPSVRKVALADVRKLLPADTPVVTPEQRQKATRERRALLQQRPLW